MKKKEIKKLPKAFKAKWVAALRSGKYKQCTGSLVEKDYLTSKITHCCLGVACEIAGSKRNKIMDQGLIEGDIAKNKFIPKLIKGNIEDSSPNYNPIVKKLTEMNDNDKSFKYIASYIERYL